MKKNKEKRGTGQFAAVGGYSDAVRDGEVYDLNWTFWSSLYALSGAPVAPCFVFPLLWGNAYD